MKHTVLISCLSGVIYEQLKPDTSNYITYNYDNVAKLWYIKLTWYVGTKLMGYRLAITDFDLDTIYQNLIIDKYSTEVIAAYNKSFN